MQSIPNFFIVGAPKCGTTAMYEYLKQHPQIFLSPVKEPYYFGSDLDYLNLQRPTEDEYLALFSDVAIEKAIGEASITYLVSEQAAEEIKAFNPYAKIIIMLRNPVEMMYSMHSQALFTQVENEENFEKALSLEQFRKQGQHIPLKTTILSFILYRELARYASQVERYFRTFGREHVHVIIYDDFKQDVAATFQKTLQFLGVDDSFQPKNFDVINRNKQVRNKFLNKTLWQPSFALKMASKLIPSSLRSKLIAELKKLNTKYIPRPQLDPEIRNQLLQEFRPEIESLQELLKRDLSLWLSEEI
jgi:hypothetical protein